MTQRRLVGVFLFVKSEHWPLYYTRQVCELDEFGRKFGFFASVLKTRYKGLLDCLNIKVSISQKKFFLTTHQNFSNFFQKIRGYGRKSVIPRLVSANKFSKFQSKFLQIAPNVPKTADLFELNRILGVFWTIVRDIPNVCPIQVVKSLTFGLNVRKIRLLSSLAHSVNL